MAIEDKIRERRDYLAGRAAFLQAFQEGVREWVVPNGKRDCGPAYRRGWLSEWRRLRRLHEGEIRGKAMPTLYVYGLGEVTGA